jgi:RNA polymerase sigma factor (sigma-70 family)
VTDDTHFDNEAGLEHLTDVFQRYRKTLARLVARIVKPHDIEDIVQDTYIRIYQASQKKPIFHAKSFMLRTARNLALNHIARADAMNHLAAGAADGETLVEANDLNDGSDVSESADTLVQAEEEFLIFCRAIRDLPLQCRRAFILRKVYGLSQREVARRLGISESTVEKHIAKGIVTSGDYMKTHGYARAGRMPTRGRRVSRGSRDE